MYLTNFTTKVLLVFYQMVCFGLKMVLRFCGHLKLQEKDVHTAEEKGGRTKYKYVKTSKSED